MKRNFVAFTLGILAMCCISNQSMAQGGFQLGIKGLANLTSIQGVDEAAIGDVKSKATLGVGLYATIKITKFGIQPEVQLLKQGSNIEPSSGNDYNQKMTYLKVPVMVNFYIIKQFHLEAGPYFGILLDAQQKLDNDPLGLGKIDNKDAFTTTDFGIAAGVGADIKRLNLSLRYMFGLSDINDVSGSTETLRNGVFQLGIGISIINKN